MRDKEKKIVGSYSKNHPTALEKFFISLDYLLRRECK
jgi:hypothetical protein